MADFLVIGYGNPLRHDDGLGPVIAARFQKRQLPLVHTIIAHQLFPEFCEAIAKSAIVVFVDAAVDLRRAVEVRRIHASNRVKVEAHLSEPASLLSMTSYLFGQV